MSNGSEHPSSGGMSGSVQRLLESIFGFVITKVELINVELEEEKRRLLELVVLTGAFILFGAFSITLVTFGIVALLWEISPWVALLVVATVYGLIALLLFFSLRRKIGTASGAFETTVEELKKDTEWLKHHL